MTLLTNEFIERYSKMDNPFPTSVGEFTYYRTYSFFLDDEKRREMWYETVRRAVEYNCGLVEGTTQAEAELMFDNMYHLRQFTSGRTLWVGGREVANKFRTSNFNCAFTVMDEIKALTDMFYLLMVGSGVGMRILKDDVKKIAKVRTNVRLTHLPYEPLPSNRRLQETICDFGYSDKIVIKVGDSKEGWSEALRMYFKALMDLKVKEIIFDYNSVRPKGELLKTFGGFASGHESLKVMFTKMHKVVIASTGKLSTLDWLDIITIIGENVVSGGTRRTAIMLLIDEDDEACINAKANITPENSHRRVSNNSILYRHKPTRNRMDWHIDQMRYNGEPAFVNLEAGRKRNPDMEGVNPCFTGDMRLLTTKGYERFDKIVDTDVIVVNKDGRNVFSEVWCSGEKETVGIKRRGMKAITCTPDHRFMTIEGDEVEAKDLKGRRLMPYISNLVLLKDHVRLGFIQGDGTLSRLNSVDHKGIEVNIGQNDDDIRFLFGFGKEGRSIYTTEYTDRLNNLGFYKEKLPTRLLPRTIDDWSDRAVKSFLCGLYSANGSVLSNGRVTLKSTCKPMLLQVTDILARFGINSYITTNKAKAVAFANGTYICKESYDLNIQDYASRLEFFNQIGFYQAYKNVKLKAVLLEQSPVVGSIVKGEVQKVYDFTEPETHWGVVEGVIAHNCGEVTMRPREMCNLVTINLTAFVTDKYEVDWKRLEEAQRLSVRIAMRMASVDLELAGWGEYDKMILGCSFTGYEDMMNLLSFGRFQRVSFLKVLREIAHEEAERYAKEIDVVCPELVTTIKPEGTISKLPTVSSGLHYSHSPYYINRIRISKDNPLSTVMRESGFVVEDDSYDSHLDVVSFPMSAPYGRTKHDVTAVEQLHNYLDAMRHYVDHNASITVHVRENEWDEVKEWMWKYWDEVVGVSFIPLDDAEYPQMPLEAITKEEYDELVKVTPKFNPYLLTLAEREHTEFDLDEEEGCSSGACPLR